MTQHDRRFLTLPWGRLAYVEEGRGDGTPLIMGHSLATRLEAWDDVADRLKSRFRIVRYDARGHGESDAPPGPYSLNDLADDVVALIKHLGVERAHYAGISMSGMLGQVLCLRHADRIRSAIHCCTVSETPEAARAMWDDRIAAVEDRGLASQITLSLERWFTKPFLREESERVARTAMMIAQTKPAGFIGWGAAIKHFNVTAELSGLRMPTLVVAAAEDQSTPPAAGRRIHEKIQGSRFVLIESSSHQAPIEKPDVVAAAFQAFIGSV